MSHLSYLLRVIPAYIFRQNSQLSFWHERPKMNVDFWGNFIGPYYMDFSQKAQYAVNLDADGIPLLDYKGHIGKQYNPIAITQHALGHYNIYHQTNNEANRLKFLKVADWLAAHLETNPHGLAVWMHHFDWEYQEKLISPWYSGLAQGQGLSVLVRAALLTQDKKYTAASERAYASFERDIHHGGVVFIDEKGNPWIEEYLVSPPTHILNGFIWALWGIYDYYLFTKNAAVKKLWEGCLTTLRENLFRFDNGFWSLYDLPQMNTENLASAFYHQLHIVQLEVLYRLTGDEIFQQYRLQWQKYDDQRFNRARAFAQKAIFKLTHY